MDDFTRSMLSKGEPKEPFEEVYEAPAVVFVLQLLGAASGIAYALFPLTISFRQPWWFGVSILGGLFTAGIFFAIATVIDILVRTEFKTRMLHPIERYLGRITKGG